MEDWTLTGTTCGSLCEVLQDHANFCISNSYGMLHKEQKLFAEAREMFVKSCQLCPMLWASWEELSKLCDDKGMVSPSSYQSRVEILFCCLKLQGLSLPNHWMKKIFTAAGYMELLLFEDAMMLYSSLVQQGFEHCPYVVSQIALAHYHLNCKLRRLTLIEQSCKVPRDGL